MANETSVERIEQLWFELEGSRNAEHLLSGFERRGTVSRERSIGEMQAQPLVPSIRGRGRRLLASSAEGARHRYETLLSIELTLPIFADFGLLIILASLILEEELHRLIVGPAETILRRLIEVLRRSDRHRRQAAILEEWSQGNFKATLGVTSLVLLALQRGLESSDVAIETFLEARFRMPYSTMVATGCLGKCLDAIRENFRNPACHGTRFSGSRITRRLCSSS